MNHGKHPRGHGSARQWLANAWFVLGYNDAKSERPLDHDHATAKWQQEFYEAGRFIAVYARAAGYSLPEFTTHRRVPKSMTRLLYDVVTRFGSSSVRGNC